MELVHGTCLYSTSLICRQEKEEEDVKEKEEEVKEKDDEAKEKEVQEKEDKEARMAKFEAEVAAGPPFTGRDAFIKEGAYYMRKVKKVSYINICWRSINMY